MDAFTEIYRRHAKDVYRFAIWLSGRPEEAEDVVSETFIRVWSRWKRIRTETVKGYLLAVARSVVREKDRRRRPTEPLDPETMDPMDPRGDPEDLAASRSELGAVYAALRELPELDRAVFVLRMFHELPYAEIARILSISISAAKVKVHRIRVKLAAQRLGDRNHATDS